METAEDFVKGLRENPLDVDQHLVFSDWLEEHGERTLAQAHRVVAKMAQWARGRLGREYSTRRYTYPGRLIKMACTEVRLAARGLHIYGTEVLVGPPGNRGGRPGTVDNRPEGPWRTLLCYRPFPNRLWPAKEDWALTVMVTGILRVLALANGASLKAAWQATLTTSSGG